MWMTQDVCARCLHEYEPKSAFCFFAIVMIKGISYGNQVKVYACPSVTS